MKKILTYVIILHVCHIFALAKPHNAFERMAEVNRQWFVQPDIPAELLTASPIEDEKEAIRSHLQWVEAILRARDVSHLSKTAQHNRQIHLAHLHTYWQEGNFPINTFLPYRNPVFIDADNNFCAVGYLMKTSGKEAVAREIQADENFDYVKDIDNQKLTEWAATSGLTLAELAWIQPGYMPSTQPQSMGNGLGGQIHDIFINPNASGITAVGDFQQDSYTWASGFSGWDWFGENTETDGTIHAIESFNGDMIYGGDFSTFQNLPMGNIAKITGGNAFPMGTLTGEVFDLQIWNGELYAGGIFGLAKWDGATWVEIGDFGYGIVHKMHIWKNKLVVAGNFHLIGNLAAENIALYDGTQFVAMGDGVPQSIYALATYKDKLFLGTTFEQQGDSLYHYAKLWYYNDTLWQNQEIWMSGHAINALEVVGNDLIVGGKFTYNPMMGTYGKNIIRVYEVGNNLFGVEGYLLLDGEVRTLKYAHNQLYIGGDFVQNCCDWDGNLTVLNSIGYVDVVTTGISPSLASTHLLCYPNPAADILTVEHEAYQSPQVIDIQGKVLPLTIEPLAIDKSKIDIESLPKGIYLIKAGNSFLKWAKNAQ